MPCDATGHSGLCVRLRSGPAARELSWHGVGNPLEELPELAPVKDKGFKNTYFRRNEPLAMGEADIRSVAYYFRKGKLYRVGIAFNGRANQFFLKDMLIRQYGPGRGIGYRYGWMWPDFSIDLDYDGDTNTGGLYFTYEGPIE